MARRPDRKAIRWALKARLQEYLPDVREWLDRPVPDGTLSIRPAAALYNAANLPHTEAPNSPRQWTLNLVLELHVQGRDVDDQLDDLIGLVEDALALQDGESAAYHGADDVTTLGGLVADCRISGQLTFFSIVEIEAGMVEIPIEVTCGPF